MMKNLKIKKLNDKAIIPTYGTKSSAGADLYAMIDSLIEIKPNESIIIPTGIAMDIPEDYVGLIYARSSLATKKGLAPANKVGVIDADYRGEIKVVLYNHSNQIQTISPNERIAQIVITPFVQVQFLVVDELDETERGTGGFGSTNK
ncbi:MAG: dUTP diphosphatase [Bacilli bacterium]|nr:dUTP diphosphatase [Bacilli bacterium]